MQLWMRFLVVAAALLLAGCGGSTKPRVLQPDITFSLNVMEVPADWPLEKRDWPEDVEQAAIRQRIYEEEGAPDYFRFRWRKDGKPVTRREVQQMLFTEDKAKRDLKKFARNRDLDVDWIYTEKGLLYRFGKKGAEKEDLNDQWKIISEYGDPHEIKEIDDPQGKITIYQYYDQGKVFYYRSTASSTRKRPRRRCRAGT
jgi:hypothetical protein